MIHPNEQPKPRAVAGAKGRQRVDAILDAATAILVDEGYASLSTRKIAARAGMLPGNLHYYYSTKHEVVRALLDRYLERATARIETRIVNAQSAPTDDPAEAALSVLFADQTNLESCRFFWELWALAARDPAVSEAMRGFYLKYWRALVAKLLQLSPALGRPRAGRRAAVIIGLLEGMTLFRSHEPPYQFPLPGLEQELRAVVRNLATEIP